VTFKREDRLKRGSGRADARSARRVFGKRESNVAMNRVSGKKAEDWMDAEEFRALWNSCDHLQTWEEPRNSCRLKRFVIPDRIALFRCTDQAIALLD